MGSGSFSAVAYHTYSKARGRSVDSTTLRASGGQSYTAKRLDESLNPKNKIRECCISKEHPNPIPIILALDVTGSMGSACKETQESLGVIMTNLYSKYKDIEFMVMGIGDLAYDDAPIQASQYESDIRIAESLDKIWLEKGGGGNTYESYTAAWYFGLHNTKLEPFDTQHRKGIIITMGDEPMNPFLPKDPLNHVLGSHEQSDVETPDLYEAATKKFDIYHIAIDNTHCCYRDYKDAIEKTWHQLLGDNFRVSTINDLSSTICECIDNSLTGTDVPMVLNEGTDTGTITW